jgi:hypothetical protein
MANKSSKIYKLIIENNIEWFMTINNTDNIYSKNFFKILHVTDFYDNVVIISDIENVNNINYRITIHDDLLDTNIININKENKSIERIINNTQSNKKNFIDIFNKKFNIKVDTIQEKNITSILSPKNIKEINQKSIINTYFKKKILSPIK